MDQADNPEPHDPGQHTKRPKARHCHAPAGVM